MKNEAGFPLTELIFALSALVFGIGIPVLAIWVVFHFLSKWW